MQPQVLNIAGGMALGGNSKDLDIKNLFPNQNINFTTTTTGPTTTQKATILANGNVGIGIATPGNLLHLHQSSTTSVYSQFTNATNNTNGFWLGVDGTTGNGIINMKDNKTIKIFTNDIHRMFIDNGTTATAGYIGIGNSFNAPASRIHMHQNSTGGTAANNDVWLQLTTYATYSGGDPVATDGFRIGVINSSLNAEIKQQENADMNFHTYATQRMTIKADGKVGIGTSFTSPANLLHIDGGLAQITNSYSGATNTDGFTIGQNASNVELKQLENADMLFFTNSTERARLSAGGNLGVGTTSPVCRLHVANDYSTTATESAVKIESAASSGNPATGIHSVVTSGNALKGFYANVDNYNSSAGINAENIGFGCQIQGHDNGSTNYGVKATAYGANQNGSSTNYGLWTSTGGANQSYDNYGIKASSNNASNACYGGHFAATNGSTINYGVYASGGTNCTATTTTTGCPSAAGYFSGDVNVTHSLYQGSDLFLKDNIQPISNASAIIDLLMPKTYTFKTQIYPSLHLADGNHFGLIAEEVENILPEIVRSFKEPEVKDANGMIINPAIDYKAINYTAIIPILIAGFKELQLQIDALNGQLKSGNSTGELQQDKNKTTVELTNAQTVYLSNAIPNPFVDNATIEFSIPENVKTAQIIFTENNGIVFKSVTIEQRGESSLTVFGENLSKGIYSYSLIIDGKVFETKRMVKQ